MFSAQSATFKDLLREQRRTYDNALMTVMNELLVALEESEVRKLTKLLSFYTIFIKISFNLVL